MKIKEDLSAISYKKNYMKIELIDSLQALRSVAFIFIFLSHSGIHFFCRIGEWGVSIFIVLSGFLMIYNYYQKTEIAIKSNNTNENEKTKLPFKNPLLFSINKIKRLYPLHIITMIAGIIIHFTDRKLIAVTLIPHLALIQILIPNEKYFACINGVAWYLSLCLFLYFAFPFILLFIKKHNKIKTIVLISAGLIVLEFLYTWLVVNYINYSNEWLSWKWLLYYCPFFRVVDFAVGCNLGFLFLNLKNNKNSKFNTGLCTILEIATISLFIVSILSGNFWGFHWSFIPIIPSCLLVYLFAIKKGLVSKLLTNKVFIYIGNISPYAFLIHSLVLSVCNNIFSGKYNIICVIISFIITIILASIYPKIDLIIRKKQNIKIKL